MDRTKFIRDPQDHPGRIGAIAHQAGVIGCKRELRVDSLAREILRNHQLALNVALEAQVSPFVEKFSQFHDKRRVLQVSKLLPIRIHFRHHFAGNVNLQMVAVGADNRFRESDRLVAACPMEGGLQHNFILRLALRLVEPGSRLRLAEHIGDAVVANAVARSEVAMRVVIECAPANAAGVLRIGGELVVNARVPQRVLSQALHLVNCFGRVGMPNEFRVQIPRMVRRFQGETKVVHGKHIFQKLGFLEITNTARLPRRIQFVRHGIRLHVEVVVVSRLVDAHAPQNDAGMIPVAADHAAHVVD